MKRLLLATGTTPTTYTVDASSAHITYKNGHKGDVTILQTGDNLGVWGKYVSGSVNVTATLIRDMSQVFSNATSTP